MQRNMRTVQKFYVSNQGTDWRDFFKFEWFLEHWKFMWYYFFNFSPTAFLINKHQALLLIATQFFIKLTSESFQSILLHFTLMRKTQISIFFYFLVLMRTWIYLWHLNDNSCGHTTGFCPRETWLVDSFPGETQICQCDRFYPKLITSGKLYRLALENRKRTKECPVDFPWQLPEMPTSRDLKFGDFCHTDNPPPPPCTINYIPPAVSPLNPSSPPKAHPLSFNLCFLGNPRCINASRNGETSLKNWNCFSLESLRSGEKSLKYSGFFFLGDLVTPTGEWEMRSSCGRLPDNPEELAWSKRCSLRCKEIRSV